MEMMDINILTDRQREKLEQQIEDNQNIIITCHKSPDGDALGSCLAWAEYLTTQHGKAPVVVIPDAFPDFLRWLPGTEQIVRYDKHKEHVELLLKTADLVFCLDFNSADRVDTMCEALKNTPAKRVMIDHHLNPDLDTVLLISRPEMSSTAELVFRIIWQMGDFESITKKCATTIYCGMMTDTGGFTYNSARPEIFYIIGLLLTKGIDKDKIYRKVYNNYSASAIKMRGYVMYERLQVFPESHACYFSISRGDMTRFHFIKGDAEGLVNEPLRIKGMRLSISLREDDRRDNLVWVSLRSVGEFTCNDIAERYFNGGGHKNASGGRLLCSLEEAEKVVAQVIDMLKIRKN